MKYLFALVLLLVPTSIALANDETDWSYVDTTVSKTVISALKSDISAGRPTDRAAKVWLRFDHANDTTVAARRTMSLYEVNCVAQTFRMLSTTEFAANGTGETYKPNYSKIQHITPSTIMSYITKVLCSAPTEPTENNTPTS